MTYRNPTTRSDVNLLPAFFFTVGSIATIALCQFHPFTHMYVLPGVVIAMTCMAGIVAGLVGRNWLVGMAFSLGMSSVAANLYFLSVALQEPIGSSKKLLRLSLNAVDSGRRFGYFNTCFADAISSILATRC